MLTPLQAAVEADLSLKTLYQHLRAGSLAGIQTEKGWRIRPDDLQTWLDERAAARTSQQSYPDELLDELAAEWLEDARARGKLPPQPPKALLARIARAIRAVEMA